ncbi:HPF/RaiA family ribosome-associated protein [Leptospira sp. GIMC2001]|uniref:HPF/RaiA family ribosome-associated protein n=1 Tax=Leptospira sp. GIMC2001 TaxID=1513297 RepID=UPI00234ADF62|nr:HPF/RaiA family ribosome-associated protein [Leptospira sp. GIMC2001]WCL49841.1 HPF/RaiA family ribosome-associated protein [Leptospira sp. GIMC2001]
MQVQVNTDHNIEGSERLVNYAKTLIEDSLGRFRDHITRIEVHLKDENGNKKGGDDKRCMMEARLEGRQPMAVTHHADTLDHALTGATDKLKKIIDTAISKIKEH